MASAPTTTPELAAINREDEAKGAVVHSFDPNASPQEKAAIAGKGADALNPVGKLAPEPQAIAVALTSGPPPPPTITISDVDQATAEEQAPSSPPKSPTSATSPSASGPPVPGALVEPYVIPDWYKVGWRQVSGIDNAPPSPLERDKSAIEQWVSDMYYGQWYHNSGIIVFAVVASHLITLLRMGWGWLFIVLATTATWYSTSITRFRRNARDDIQRELVKNHLATEFESADWLNNFLDRFWIIYEPVLSKTIVASVDQILSYSTPSFLDSLRLSHFTLGNCAPRIDKVRTFPLTPSDVVLMDWNIKFTPMDTTDLTQRQKELRTNPKITLDVKVGKGPATATFPILVEDLSFSGHMRIKLKLMSAFPHVQIIEMSFMAKPEFDYVLKPIGGESFGWDVGNIPGLSAFIREMVHSILGPMMYDPNVFTLNLEQLWSGAPLDAAIGVIAIHVVSAKALKGSKIGGGTPDPYVSLSINNRAPVAQTAWRHNTANPHWGSTHFITITQSNLSETLTLTVMDYNDVRKDSVMGQASFELNNLLEDATQEGLSKEIFRDGKERGELQFDVSYFPVIKPAIVDGKPEPLPDSNVGICRLVIHQAKDLDKRSGDLNPKARVYLAGSKTHHFETPVYRHTLAPVWEAPTEFLVPNKKKGRITIEVIDDRDFLKDPVVGTLTTTINDILEATATKGREAWFPLSHCSSGKVRLSAEWKPLEMAGSLQGAGSYSPPIGVVRLWIKRAKDVKNVEATLGGKSDPYVRVMLNGVVKARTDVVNNNLNPEWDQIVYVPVHSLRETLVLETMDYQNLTKDRSLGTVELKVGDLASENAESVELPYSGKGKIPATSPIHLDKNVVKGSLEYEAEFVPSLNIKGIEFDERNELEKAVDDTTREEEAAAAGDRVEKEPSSESSSSSDADYEKVSPEPKSPTTTEGAAPEEGKEKSANGHQKRASVDLSKDELLHRNSGIIIFNVKNGQLNKKSRLEILLDDSYWPAFATDKARSHHAKWDAVGEGFIRELDFGRIWLRLNENDDGEKENIVGEFKCDAKMFLEKCLDKDEEFTLSTPDENRIGGRVTLTAKYVPVEIKLEARESINNMGTLRVDLLDGHDIAGADRSGKSDPFVTFTLNEQRVFKSEVKKKTLAPVWNENFVVSVPSRVGASFSLEVFDWNQIEQAKSLGSGSIELSTLEPFQATEVKVQINSSKHGEKGEIRLRLLFQPEIIVKSRKNTSTFSSAGRAMTQIGHAPVGATRGVVHGVSNVGKFAKGVFSKPKSIDEGAESDNSGSVGATGGSAAGPSVSLNDGPATPMATTPFPSDAPSADYGTVRVTFVGAKDLSLPGESSFKPYVVMRVGREKYEGKDVGKTTAPEWEETFSFQSTPETKGFNFGVFDHKTFGKDKMLGEADIDIWKSLRPSGPSPVPSADFWVDLRSGTGQVHLRLDFERGHAKSISGDAKNRLLGSPSRFSLTKRTSTDDY